MRAEWGFIGSQKCRCVGWDPETQVQSLMRWGMRPREGQLCPRSHREARQPPGTQHQLLPRGLPRLQGSLFPEGSCLNCGLSPVVMPDSVGHAGKWTGAIQSPQHRGWSPRPSAPSHSSRTLEPRPLARSDPTWTLWKACPTHPGVKTKGHVPSSRGPHWLAQGRRAENMLVAMGAPIRTRVHKAQGVKECYRP